MSQREAANVHITEAGFKRLRTSTACEPCRKRKLKCNGVRPCETCTRRKVICVFNSSEGPAVPTVPLPGTPTDDSSSQVTSVDFESRTSRIDRVGVKEVSAVPILDAYLNNIHPVACHNFLHHGTVFELNDQGYLPEAVLMACGAVAAKKTKNVDTTRWAERAKLAVFQSLDNPDLTTIAVLVTLALHEVHLGRMHAAWHLICE